jgi:hypothetical protein
VSSKIRDKEDSPPPLRGFAPVLSVQYAPSDGESLSQHGPSREPYPARRSRHRYAAVSEPRDLLKDDAEILPVVFFQPLAQELVNVRRARLRELPDRRQLFRVERDGYFCCWHSVYPLNPL